MTIDRGPTGMLRRAAAQAEERLHLAALNLNAAEQQLDEEPDDEVVWTWVEQATREVKDAKAIWEEMHLYE